MPTVSPNWMPDAPLEPYGDDADVDSDLDLSMFSDDELPSQPAGSLLPSGIASIKFPPRRPYK